MLPAQPLLANCKFEGIWRYILLTYFPMDEIAVEIVHCWQAKRADFTTVERAAYEIAISAPGMPEFALA